MKEMYNLTELATMALDNLNAIGIYPHLTPNDFSVNTRAKNRYGQARYRNGKYSVNISAFLLDKRNDEKSILQTIYHECLHCCDNCMCHTGEWKRLAELVNDCYNMDITRCSNFSERLNEEVLKEKTEEKIIKQKSFKWKCSACGQTFTKISSRTPKWYMHPKGYTHKNCPCGKGYVMSEYYNYKLI